jgi:hypothetical protein
MKVMRPGCAQSVMSPPLAGVAAVVTTFTSVEPVTDLGRTGEAPGYCYLTRR